MFARDCSRGDVIRVNLDPSIGREQTKTRPCLVVQTPMLRRAQTTIVVPISEGRQDTKLPFLVPIPKGEAGLTKDSHLLIHQIRVIDESRIVEKLGTVRLKTLAEVDAALKFTLHIDQG
jgi:mRNA interferase MazF